MPETESLIYSAGGLGLFLLGMIIMTDNLRKLAGDEIRATILRFTKTPTSGAITGAITTALVQSSSATTVAAVGFVGAGLMAFSSALGIIFGANIGTTITGWMVALLGFKYSIDTIALPIILFGAMMRLFTDGKLAHTSLAIAGFGLIFVGINSMQTGMQGMRDFIDFSQLPANDLIGLLKLVFLGLIFTVLTQASSAGVAITLTALYSGIVDFEQAAALVIGFDVGTTVTSLIATIGGTRGAKRTGYSHVFYNLLTAIIALLFIAPYTMAWDYFSPGALQNNAEIALVGFHSLFNILGVMLILPMTKYFSAFMYKLVPEPTETRVSGLDKQLLRTPELALNVVQNTLIDLGSALLQELNAITTQKPSLAFKSNLNQLQQDLDKTQAYLDAIHLHKNDSRQWKRLVSMIHMLDHLQRLHERCEEEPDRAQASKDFSDLQAASNEMAEVIHEMAELLAHKKWHQLVRQTKALHKFVDKDAELHRRKMVNTMGQGKIDAEALWDSLEAIRWMQRVSHHLYRLSYHLEQMLLNSGK